MVEARAGQEVGIDRRRVALADQHPRAAALVAVISGAHAVIDPLAAVDPIETGEAIAPEQAGLVELEALAVLVRDGGRVLAPGRSGDHGDGLDDLAGTFAAADPGIAPGEGELRESTAGERGLAAIADADGQIVRVVAVAAQAERHQILLADRILERQLPFRAERHAARVDAPQPRQVEQVALGGEPPADGIGPTLPAVVCDRRHDRLNTVAGAWPQALEGPGADVAVALRAEALAIDMAGEESGRRRDVIAQQIGLVRRALNVEPAAPVIGEVELAGGEEVPAYGADRRCVDRVRLLAADSDAAVGGELTVAEALAILGAEILAALGGEHRPERCVLVLVDRPEIGNAEVEAVGARIADARREKAALALHRRVGMREIGGVEDRDAVDLHHRVAVLDDLLLLVADDLLGLDLPHRRARRILAAGLAGRVNAAADLDAIPLDAPRGVAGQPRAVGQQHAQIADEAIAQIVVQLDEIGEDHVAGGLEQTDMARGGDRVGALVV